MESADLNAMKKINLILVDDNEHFLDLTTQFIQLDGDKDLQILETSTEGEEAIQKILELKPDIVLVDLVMPGISGLEVIKALRQNMPDMGIIALTLMDDSTYRDISLSLGADEFVRKNTLSTDLIPSIHRVFETVQKRKNLKV